MNKVVLMGRLTKDVEVRYSANGSNAVARTSIAVQKKYKKDGEAEADFFNVTAFGKTAEFMEKYFGKGKMIAISGRVENDNYTDKDGRKVYGTRILAEECDFCGSAGESSTDAGKVENKANNEAREGYMDVPDNMEDLPFN